MKVDYKIRQIDNKFDKIYEEVTKVKGEMVKICTDVQEDQSKWIQSVKNELLHVEEQL